MLLSHSQAGCENSGREAGVRFPIFKKQDAAGVDIDAGGGSICVDASKCGAHFIVECWTVVCLLDRWWGDMLQPVSLAASASGLSHLRKDCC